MFKICRLDIICVVVVTLFGLNKGQVCDDSLIVINPSEEQEGEEGTSILMSCILLCDPGDFFVTEWYKKGEKVFTYEHSSGSHTPSGDLVGRSSGRLNGLNHVLNITRLTMTDDGAWKCKLASAPGAESRDVNLRITVTPEPSQIIIAGEPAPLAGTIQQYTSTVKRLKPQYSVKWYRVEEEIPGDPPAYTDNADGTQSLTSTRNINITIVGRYDVKCLLSQGSTEIQSSLTVEASASPWIENYTPVNTTLDPDTDELKFSCTASGTDVSVSWLHNGTALNMELFNISNGDVFGEYRYGQTSAKISTITWSRNINCEDLNMYIGTYQCKATNIHEEVLSSISSYNVQYKPRDKEVNNKKPVEGEAFNITCPCCANPAITSWEWSVEGKETFPPDIEGQGTEQLYIQTVAEYHINDIYQCTATNDKGSTQFKVSFVEGQVAGLSAGEIVAIVASILAIVAIVVVIFVVLKKKKQKADEEVVAYAESGNRTDTNTNGRSNTGNTQNTNTAPVYSEVTKDKKVNSSSSKGKARPVYAEVDKSKKKGAKNSEEPTGPVYSQVNKPSDRPLPQLKSKPSSDSTNTGHAYSEINKSKRGRLTPIEAQHHGGGNEYEEAGYIGGKPLPPIKNARHYDNAGQRNEHGGLHYADVDFLRQGNGTKQSHGTKNPAYEPTEYAQIDHRKSTGIVV